MDVSDRVYPYGAFADQTVFRRSLAAKKLDKHNLGLAPEDEDDGDDKTMKGVLQKCLADKGYKGIPTLITPHKHSKRKKLTDEQKDFNRELSGRRSVVEQVQGRMKQWALIGTKFRGKKHDEEEEELLSLAVKVIASLVNYKLESQPIRRSPRKIKHPKKKAEFDE